jgi:hypothetical protein
MTNRNKSMASIKNPTDEERTRFIAWLRGHVPAKYRERTKTPGCVSAKENFGMLHSATKDPYERHKEQRKSLSMTNFGLAEYWSHIFGNGEEACERCLRVLNAFAIYQARHHPEIFTDEARKVIDLELRTRNHEHMMEREGYRGNGLYLFQVKVPLNLEGDQETHLLFYDKNSVNHGKDTLRKMLAGNPELEPFTQFGEIKPFNFPRTQYTYSSTTSHLTHPIDGSPRKTAIDIVSRDPVIRSK